MSQMSQASRPTVLITNDDGPPNPVSSPFVFGLVQEIERTLGWNCLVVLPDSQKSWIGKAFLIHAEVPLYYHYPQLPDGHSGETAETRRPLKDGEPKEWLLLGGTPATCSSIGLRSLYPGKIDMVISGPNFGRNTSAGFALSSGTIGAALSAAMNYVPAVALSYGVFKKPIDPAIVDAAHQLSCRILKQLWESGFVKQAARTETDDLVDLYNVNVPLVPQIVTAPAVRFATLANARYGQLFSLVPQHADADQTDATAADEPTVATKGDGYGPVQLGGKLRFEFKPDIGHMINPLDSELVAGTDKHAIHHGAASVTPLRAAFAAGLVPSELKKVADTTGLWKL